MTLAVVLALLSVWTNQPDEGVVFVGTFHDLRQTDDHAYGNVLELWRDGDRLVGRWSRAEGPPADFPTVELERVTFDKSSGELEFAALWCGRAHRFEGSMGPDSVIGRLRDDTGRERERVRLARDRSDQRESRTRSGWRREWAETLRRLRPRCE